MPDRIEKLGHSVVQHGKANDRVYLMKLARCDLPHIQDDLKSLAEKHHYSKIFCKVPAWARKSFEKKGFEKEAEIPAYYQGRTDLIFYSQFLDENRKSPDPEQEKRMEKVFGLVKKKEPVSSTETDSFHMRPLSEDNAKDLAELYRQVFDSYPFPIFDPDYLTDTMKSHVDYFGAFDSERLIAASSAEQERTAYSVEMTDFATLPDFRGRGLATSLLRVMEDVMKEKGMMTAYTIARAMSLGMNITFARSGYAYSGTLVNNTQISGNIESMNVWYKSLRSM
ncbi:putative beta-lysine N-acetyltransferase [candidate division KSB1 bacterium]|nr:putative beta-lysine N-acetyltransferase [candidate division KSB1 bacterium]